MAKYLIVNADDFGLCHSANEAVFDLFLKGRLKSSTIMMPCVGAIEAIEFSKAHPEFAIGVHLTMTAEWARPQWRWKPLSNSPSLLDEDGFMWHESDMVGHNAKLNELEREARAQMDFAHRMGMKPSHIDNHMGSLYGHETGRLSLLFMTIRLMGEYGYAYRLYTKTDKRVCPRGVPYPLYKASGRITSALSKKHGVIMPDYLLFPDWTKDMRENGYENYRDTILKIWTDIPDGVTETFVHPSVESDEIKQITNLWHCRVWEYRLLGDPYVWDYLKAHGVEMISYRDLIRMKQGGNYESVVEF